MTQIKRLGQLLDVFNTDPVTIRFQALNFLSLIDTTLFS